jgi:hypothetical protein
MQYDPKLFGLPARTILLQLEDNTVALVIDRKSRIIMADGQKIVEKFKILKRFMPQANFALKTSAPLCSKTRLFLETEDIRVIS